ncbi:leucine-rich repeat domain-containing protein [Lysinibacillus xylanilyticus]|uniref:leucine-rich repeat domain-containing protein n=1 Tax=Lysinibacillus xylanilyticus TaxID=582475 RepID=UPI0036DF3F42
MDEVKVLELLGCKFREIQGSGCLLSLEPKYEEVNLPDEVNGVKVKTVGRASFSNRKIKRLKLSNFLETVEACAFSNNELEEVVVPRNVKYLGYLAFSNNPLTRVILPPSVISIDEYAFADTNDSLVIVCQENSCAHIWASTYGYKTETLIEEKFNKLYE